MVWRVTTFERVDSPMKQWKSVIASLILVAGVAF